MNLKKIMRLCSAEKTCYILRNPITGKQWIGTLSAIYPVEGVELSESMIPYLFGIEDCDREDWVIEERMGGVPQIEITDDDPRAELWGNIAINWHGNEDVPLMRKDRAGEIDRVCWIRSDAIGPASAKGKTIDYRMRGDIALFGIGLLANGAAATLKAEEAEEIREMLRGVMGADWD